jgi:hypothetical protein
MARAISYLERRQTDVRSEIRSLRFSADQARNRLAIARQVDAWLHDLGAAPDPDSLVMKVHFAGVLFPPMTSTFTIDELKSNGDLRLLKNEALKRQIADWLNLIELQVDQWMAWGDVGVTETYFREVAFVLDPELRLRAGSFDPSLVRRVAELPTLDWPPTESEPHRFSRRLFRLSISTRQIQDVTQSYSVLLTMLPSGSSR